MPKQKSSLATIVPGWQWYMHIPRGWWQHMTSEEEMPWGRRKRKEVRQKRGDAVRLLPSLESCICGGSLGDKAIT